MSWGASIRRRKLDEYRNGEHWVFYMPSQDDEVWAAFKVAYDRLCEQHNVKGIEYFLQQGTLASRATAKAIEAATGIVPYGYEWTAEQVREVAAKADWSRPLPEGVEEGNMLSAKVFFEVCVEQNLGLEFD